jgi:hypothetical protein
MGTNDPSLQPRRARRAFALGSVLLILVVGVVAQGAVMAPAKSKRTFRVIPTQVEADGSITLRGTGWRRRSTIELYIGPPQSEGTLVARTRTNSRGTFNKRVSLDSELEPGPWVALACRRQCRVKKTARFTVVP